MAEVASAFVSLMPSAKGFGTSTERQIAPQMNSVAKRTGARFGKVFAYASMSPLKAIGAAAIGLFAVQKVKQFFQGAIGEAREAQKVSAITAQVIKSTGGAANISAQQVGRLATSISNMTGIDDEAIQTGANLLLTFKNLRNEAGKGNNVFNQATSIITDMSVALGTDVKGSAIQVGKALNDPIKGISALTRVGVTFTEQQKKQIETLVSSGRRLQAQKIILGELRSEFGGTAAAAATAGDRFKVAFANFQESVGTALLPLLDRLQLEGIKVLAFLQTDVPRAFDTLKTSVAPVVEVVRQFVENHLPAFQTALAALGGSAIASLIGLMGGGLISAIGVLVGALASPIALVGALAGAFLYAYRTSEQFRTQVNVFAAWAQANLVPALMQIGATLRDDVGPALLSFGQWLVGTAYPAAIRFWTSVGQQLQPSLVQLAGTFKSDLLPALQLLGQRFKESQPTLEKVAVLIIRLEAVYALFAASVLGKVLPPLIRLTGFMASNQAQALNVVFAGVTAVIGVLLRLGGVLSGAGQDVSRLARLVVDKFGEAVSFVRGVPGKITAALAGLYAIGVHAATQLVAGLVDTFRAKVGEVAGAISGIAGAIKDHFPGSPVKTGPLTSWNNGGAGKRLIQMLADGIIAGTPAVTAAALGAADGVQKAVLEKLTSMRDGVKGVLDGLRSDFTSLASSVSSAFNGDQFNFDNVGDFMRNLVGTRSELRNLKQAFKKLLGWGVAPEFLSSLFQSGNGGLILELAAGNRLTAQAAGMVFGEIGQLGGQLGGQVARAEIGPKIDKTNQRLERIEKAIDRLPTKFGQELNGAVGHGQRRAS